MPNPRIIACIPARYASTRFPAKVLAKETGKFLIQHTWEQVRKATLPHRIIIAADNAKIADACAIFGAECVLTSEKCPSGTDRIAEAAAYLDAEIILNIQADEPEIDPDNIDTLARLMLENPSASMATLLSSFKNAVQVADPNIVKAIIDSRGRGIYFSRSVIPYDRENAGVGDVRKYLRHIGIYAYRKDFLLKLTSLPPSPLETSEKLEQLRAIENGFDIFTAKVTHTCDGIDTPEQYAEFVKRYVNLEKARG